MKKIIPISKLRVGQKFRFIPDDWFGPAKLIEKKWRREFPYTNNSSSPAKSIWLIDIKFHGRVVNSPGITYGMRDTTKVKLISEKDWQSRWEK